MKTTPQRVGVVAGSVGVHAKLIFGQIDGPRVFQSNRIIRIGMKRNSRNHGQEHKRNGAKSFDVH
jgi:hypothetical protein